MRLLRVPLSEEGDTRLTKLIKVVRLPDHSFTFPAELLGMGHFTVELLTVCGKVSGNAAFVSRRPCGNGVPISSENPAVTSLLLGSSSHS